MVGTQRSNRSSVERRLRSSTPEEIRRLSQQAPRRSRGTVIPIPRASPPPEPHEHAPPLPPTIEESPDTSALVDDLTDALYEDPKEPTGFQETAASLLPEDLLEPPAPMTEDAPMDDNQTCQSSLPPIRPEGTAASMHAPTQRRAKRDTTQQSEDYATRVQLPGQPGGCTTFAVLTYSELLPNLSGIVTLPHESIPSHKRRSRDATRTEAELHPWLRWEDLPNTGIQVVDPQPRGALPISSHRFQLPHSLDINVTVHKLSWNKQIRRQLKQYLKRMDIPKDEYSQVFADFRVGYKYENGYKLVDIPWLSHLPPLDHVTLTLGSDTLVWQGRGSFCPPHYGTITLEGVYPLKVDDIAMNLNQQLHPHAVVLDIWELYDEDSDSDDDDPMSPSNIYKVLIVCRHPSEPLTVSREANTTMHRLPGYINLNNIHRQLNYIGRRPHCPTCRADATEFHVKVDCPRRRCRNCNQTGHLANACPKTDSKTGNTPRLSATTQFHTARAS